ncbi:MAG: GDSL-type esterase/lipase family protein [Clostridia bacterium]
MNQFKRKISIVLVYCMVLFVFSSVSNGYPFGIKANASATVQSTFEAEKAKLSSKSLISKKASGYSGTGFVLFPAKKAGATLTIKPVTKASESLQIEIKFANGNKNSSALVLVLNGKGTPVYFAKTFGASKWKMLIVTKTFKKGTNTLTLKRAKADADSVSIDRIRLLKKIIPTPNPIKVKFKGKKVVCMGDSITAFCGYPEELEADLGTTVYNTGVGGAKTVAGSGDIDQFSLYQLSLAITTGDWTTQDAAVARIGNGNTSTNYATLKSIDFTTIDYIIMAYGTNDFAMGIPIGTDTDFAPAQNTFKGAINQSLALLKAKYPNIKIMLVTPIFRHSAKGDSDSYDWGTGHYLIEFVDATIQVGALNSVPVLDNYRNSKINKDTYTKYLNDGTHPNYLGAEYIASKVANYMFTQF